jgi:hypothetical protein
MTGELADYQAMTPKALKQVLVAEYRCREKGCLLLHVWQTPRGRYWYRPPYNLSPQVAESQTVESARRKRTSDGFRNWNPSAGSFDGLLDSLAYETELEDGTTVMYFSPQERNGLSVTCDHVRDTLTAERLAAIVRGVTPGSPGKAFLPADTPE